jgi:hypothetical protein
MSAASIRIDEQPDGAFSRCQILSELRHAVSQPIRATLEHPGKLGMGADLRLIEQMERTGSMPTAAGRGHFRVGRTSRRAPATR